MKKFYLFTIFLSFTTSILFAQKKLSDNMYLTTLPNGLDVLVVEDNSVPLATIMMTFKSGSFAESEQTNGLSGMYQFMTFDANKDYKTASEFSFHMGHLGVGLKNSQSAEEYSRSFFTLPKANLDEGLALMNTATRFPQINTDDLEKEIRVNDRELLEKESLPGFILNREMSHHLWGDLYYRKTAVGNHDAIQSATRELLIDSIKNKYYYPNNALLIVAGDVKHDEVFKKVEEIYGSWKAAGFDPLKKWPIPEFKPLHKSDYFIVDSKLSRAPVILINWQGPDTRHDLHSTYAADVFSYILNQNSSTIKKALIQSGLALNVNINYLTLKHVGPITLTVTPNPAKVRECMEEIKKQISLMDNDDYLTNEQIETAKRKLGITKIREEEITTDYVRTLSFWWASASIDYFITYNDNLKKISRADLQAYVNKYIKNRPYCAGLLINPELKAQINAESFFTDNNITGK